MVVGFAESASQVRPAGSFFAREQGGSKNENVHHRKNGKMRSKATKMERRNSDFGPLLHRELQENLSLTTASIYHSENSFAISRKIIFNCYR